MPFIKKLENAQMVLTIIKVPGPEATATTSQPQPLQPIDDLGVVMNEDPAIHAQVHKEFDLKFLLRNPEDEATSGSLAPQADIEKELGRHTFQFPSQMYSPVKASLIEAGYHVLPGDGTGAVVHLELRGLSIDVTGHFLLHLKLNLITVTDGHMETETLAQLISPHADSKEIGAGAAMA
ncbi:hypothetical protein Hte_008887 [Hypoxylon texense]